jgi:hypothetical protein
MKKQTKGGTTPSSAYTQQLAKQAKATGGEKKMGQIHGDMHKSMKGSSHKGC